MDQITIREALIACIAGLAAGEVIDTADTVEIYRKITSHAQSGLGSHGIDNMIDANDACTIADEITARFF